MELMGRTLEDFIAEAAKQLKAAGWRIARCQGGPDVAWHLAARRGGRWRVVQVLVPATLPASRQQERIRLGQAAQLTGRAGSMEQWLGHIRPGGHVTFGLDILSGSVWGRQETEQELTERLGLDGSLEPATAPPALAGPAPMMPTMLL